MTNVFFSFASEAPLELERRFDLDALSVPPSPPAPAPTSKWGLERIWAIIKAQRAVNILVPANLPSILAKLRQFQLTAELLSVGIGIEQKQKPPKDLDRWPEPQRDYERKHQREMELHEPTIYPPPIFELAFEATVSTIVPIEGGSVVQLVLKKQ